MKVKSPCQKKNCPECEKSNYSLNYESKNWRCWCCGAKINIKESTEERERYFGSN